MGSMGRGQGLLFVRVGYGHTWTDCPGRTASSPPPLHLPLTLSPACSRRPFVTSWMASKPREALLVDKLNALIDKYMEAVLEHKRLHCK